MPDSASETRVAIGGIGGSGTRVVANMVAKFGFYLGSDLNIASDNLWFTLLFKHKSILQIDDEQFSELYHLFCTAMRGHSSGTLLPEKVFDVLSRFVRGENQDREWVLTRLDSMRAALTTPVPTPGRWGWKEPNTHIVVDRIAGIDRDLRYIHVARNGLDMAFSKNQNQLRLWGPAALGDRMSLSPAGSLAYWCWAHKRILKIGAALGERFLFLNFDEMCKLPIEGVEKIRNFLGVPLSEIDSEMIARMIVSPRSIGRSTLYGHADFDPDDVAYVEHLGFKA